MKIIWTDTALHDLNMIYNYREPETAKNIVASILNDVDILSKFPNIAPIDPLFTSEKKGIRSLVVASGRYKVIYYTQNKVINIARIWDCRQKP